MLTTKKINRAIAHTGLEVWGNGDGYFYFLDLKTRVQRGANVNVHKLNHAPLEMWVECAEIAAKSNLFEGFEICWRNQRQKKSSVQFGETGIICPQNFIRKSPHFSRVQNCQSWTGCFLSVICWKNTIRRDDQHFAISIFGGSIKHFKKPVDNLFKPITFHFIQAQSSTWWWQGALGKNQHATKPQHENQTR